MAWDEANAWLTGAANKALYQNLLDDATIMGITAASDVLEGSDQSCCRRCMSSPGIRTWLKAVLAFEGFLSADGKAGLLILVIEIL